MEIIFPDVNPILKEADKKIKTEMKNGDPSSSQQKFERYLDQIENIKDA